MVLIISPTFHRNEKYCDVLIDLMDKMWPGHPTIWFITDRGNMKYKNKICHDSRSWVLQLLHGLKYLKGLYPDLEYIYIICEDAFPLWPCDVTKLSEIQNFVLAHRLDYVSFATGYWLGEYKGEIGGVKLSRVPKSFLWYSQLQPTLCKLSYFIEICEYAVKNKISNCWEFEFIAAPGEHYVSDYRWPTAFSGFLRGGLVNPLAIKKIKLPEGKRIKHMLIKDYIFVWPLERWRRIRDTGLRKQLMHPLKFANRLLKIIFFLE